MASSLGVPAAGPPLQHGGESMCEMGLAVRVSNLPSKALPCPFWQLGTAGH